MESKAWQMPSEIMKGATRGVVENGTFLKSETGWEEEY